MRIVFMGSAAFACASFDRLLACSHVRVVAVVTQPDRPRGRSQELGACPVKIRTEPLGIPVLTPESVNAADSVQALRDLRPDLIVVVAYGQILRSALLGLPALGCVNLHASLLPRYRGAAPIQRAIANGESVTGVTTQFMSERMDAGDIILSRSMDIAEDDTGGSLHDKLAAVGADLIAATVDRIRAGTAPRLKQDETAATLAPKLTKADGLIDWSMPAATLRNRIRAFNPWPACHVELPAGSGRTLKVLKARVEAAGRGRPGDILDAAGDGPLVQAGDGALRLLEVQPPGRKLMTGAEYLRGHRLSSG